MTAKRLPGTRRIYRTRSSVRRAVAATALLLAIVIGLVVGGIGGSRALTKVTKADSTSGCACAGYAWAGGDVTSVSATWQVPRVAADTIGIASTWVGAQAGVRFIQIGVREGREIPKGRQYANLSPAAFLPGYAAFWSDTEHGFHPVSLGTVDPGDTVHASLSLKHGRWWLVLVDKRAALSVHFATGQEAGSPLQEAEWEQEDEEANAETHQLRPYPRLSPVRFWDLRVNGAGPGDEAYPQTWEWPGTHLKLVPSGLRGVGAFTVRTVS